MGSWIPVRRFAAPRNDDSEVGLVASTWRRDCGGFSAIRPVSGMPRSNAQMAFLDRARGFQLRRAAGPHHPSALDDVVPVGDAGEGLDVLVDQQDRLAGGLEPGQAAPYLGAQQRR